MIDVSGELGGFAAAFLRALGVEETITIEDIIENVLEILAEDSSTNDGLWPLPPASVEKEDELRWPEHETRDRSPDWPFFTGHRFGLGENA